MGWLIKDPTADGTVCPACLPPDRHQPAVYAAALHRQIVQCAPPTPRGASLPRRLRRAPRVPRAHSASRAASRAASTAVVTSKCFERLALAGARNAAGDGCGGGRGLATQSVLCAGWRTTACAAGRPRSSYCDERCVRSILACGIVACAIMYCLLTARLTQLRDKVQLFSLSALPCTNYQVHNWQQYMYVLKAEVSDRGQCQAAANRGVGGGPASCG